MSKRPSCSGFLIDHEVRQTASTGLGVFARAPVRSGTRVWRHVEGQFAVYDEAGFLRLIDGKAADWVVYELTHVFGLAEFPECLIRVFDDAVLINHSDHPNLRTNRAAGAKRTITDPEGVAQALLHDRYALFAARDIAAGEELVLDYSADVHDPPFYLRLCNAFGVHEDYF